MDSLSSSQTHRAQEVKAIWNLSKRTFRGAKTWVKWSSGKSSVGTSRTVVQVGGIGVNGNNDPSLSTSTPNPFGKGPSSRNAVEDLSRQSLGSASATATVADGPTSPAIQASLTAPSPNLSNEDDGASLHYQAGRRSFFEDIVRRLFGASPTAASEEDLEMGIVPVRNPASRQFADPIITSPTSSRRIVPSPTLVEDASPQQIDSNVDLIERRIQNRRKFHVHTIVGIIASIVSVVGAVATAYAAFRHGGSNSP